MREFRLPLGCGLRSLLVSGALVSGLWSLGCLGLLGFGLWALGREPKAKSQETNVAGVGGTATTAGNLAFQVITERGTSPTG